MIVTAALLLAANASAPSAARAPALDVDFPDPFVLPAEGRLHVYATNTVRRGRAINVQLSHSDDGVSRNAPLDALPQPPP